MKVFKRIVSALILAMIILALAGCSFVKNMIGKKDLSGEYTFEEFYELVGPAEKVLNEAIDYSNEKELYGEEYKEAVKKPYTEKLKEIGFKGNETITLNACASGIYYISEVYLYFYTNDYSECLNFTCDPEAYDWAVLIKDGEEIQIQFQVLEDEDGYFYYSKADILSPTKPEYKANCADVADAESAVVYGKVVNIYTFNLTEDEIREARENADGIIYYWYDTMLYSDYFIVLEDDTGNQVGAFVDLKDEKDIDLGDKIGCSGMAYQLSEEGLPEYFLDCSLLGGYYVFDGQ